MATIKLYTDLQQSKKLAEILPRESADMYYEKGISNNYRIDFGNHADISISKNLLHFDAFPCWSLPALLSVIKERNDCNALEMFTNRAQLYTITTSYYKDASWKDISTMSDNPVDACYEMIIKLHELNLL